MKFHFFTRFLLLGIASGLSFLLPGCHTGTKDLSPEEPAVVEQEELSSSPEKSLESASETQDKAQQEPFLSQSDDEPYTRLLLLTQVMELLREDYADAEQVTYDKLLDGALRGMLGSLDPFSSYIDPESYEESVRNENDETTGIGVYLQKIAGEPILILGVLPEGPAAAAGIKPFDIILSINGIDTIPIDLDECRDLLSGVVNSEIQLEIYRDEDQSTQTVPVRREVYHRKSIPVNGVKMLDEGIGYIRLEGFTRGTATELDNALKKLKEQPLNGLILDLRDNPGGLVTTAVEVCSRFLNRDELVVTLEGRSEADKEIYHALADTPKDILLPLVILINRSSASAAELTAACLQDHQRATLVGEKSFGKGSVQRIQELPNQGAARFTIAKYFTPAHKPIHGVGVEPDVYAALPGALAGDLHALLVNDPGTLTLRLSDGTETTDQQLATAIETMKKMISSPAGSETMTPVPQTEEAKAASDTSTPVASSVPESAPPQK